MATPYRGLLTLSQRARCARIPLSRVGPDTQRQVWPIAVGFPLSPRSHGTHTRHHYHHSASETQDTASRPSGVEDTTEPSCSISETPFKLPDTIPSPNRARTLILCFDGTGDQFDLDNSNIVEFFSMLKKDDRSKQMVYYQAGIGTHPSAWQNENDKYARKFVKLSKYLDQLIAWNLPAHVMDGYKFLMQNYQAGDRICLFGVSRGAYIARSLAGMINKVGLLPASNYQQVPFAYNIFKNTKVLGWDQSSKFKKAFSVDVDIEFIGVWDTVRSVGITSRSLPFTAVNSIVKTFRHAVALDERRVKFRANHWSISACAEEAHELNPGPEPRCNSSGTGVGSGEKAGNGLAFSPGWSSNTVKQKVAECSQHDRCTDVEEVWFAGCHCDVGGGSVPNDTPNTLARIPLRWMVRECFKAETGILFETKTLWDIGLDPNSLYPNVKKRPPRVPGTGAIIQSTQRDPSKVSQIKTLELEKTSAYEENQEYLDALSPMYDKLLQHKFWWIVELIPWWRDWQKSYKCNLGNGRYIPGQEKETKVHRSVQTRMEALHKDYSSYIPKASFKRAEALGNLKWVE